MKDENASYMKTGLFLRGESGLHILTWNRAFPALICSPNIPSPPPPPNQSK